MAPSSQPPQETQTSPMLPADHEELVGTSYLARARRAMELERGFPQQRPAQQQQRSAPLQAALSPDGASAAQKQPALSDCETAPGDTSSSDHSDSEQSDSEQPDTTSHGSPVSMPNEPTVQHISDYATRLPALSGPPVEVPLVPQQPEVRMQTPGWGTTCSFDHKQLQTRIETKKLSSEADLFVPKATRTQLSASAPTWSPVAVEKASHSMKFTGVSASVAKQAPTYQRSDHATKLSSEAQLFVPCETNIKSKKLSIDAKSFEPSGMSGKATKLSCDAKSFVPRSSVQAPPPGLSMPLRKEVNAFVPRDMKASCER